MKRSVHECILELLKAGEFDLDRRGPENPRLAATIDKAFMAGVLTRADCYNLWDTYLERMDERRKRNRTETTRERARRWNRRAPGDAQAPALSSGRDTGGGRSNTVPVQR